MENPPMTGPQKEEKVPLISVYSNEFKRQVLHTNVRCENKFTFDTYESDLLFKKIVNIEKPSSPELISLVTMSIVRSDYSDPNIFMMALGFKDCPPQERIQVFKINNSETHHLKMNFHWEFDQDISDFKLELSPSGDLIAAILKSSGKLEENQKIFLWKINDEGLIDALDCENPVKSIMWLKKINEDYFIISAQENQGLLLWQISFTRNQKHPMFKILRRFESASGDEITAFSINQEQNLLAAVDLANVLVIWKSPLEKKNELIFRKKNLNNIHSGLITKIEYLSKNYDFNLLTGDVHGKICLWDDKTKNVKLLRAFIFNDGCFLDLTWNDFIIVGKSSEKLEDLKYLRFYQFLKKKYLISKI